MTTNNADSHRLDAETLRQWLESNESVTTIDVRTPAEFERAGGQVVRGRQRWAMERQVRLVAGSLVTASIATSLLAPKARFLAGVVGAGLTFSAVTNTCAMARALSVLPYNRGAKALTGEEAIGQLPTSRAA